MCIFSAQALACWFLFVIWNLLILKRAGCAVARGDFMCSFLLFFNCHVGPNIRTEPLDAQ